MGKTIRHDNYAYDLEYEASEYQKKRRAERNRDRRRALRDGRVKKGDTMDIHHPHDGGKTKVLPRSRNRSIK